MASSDQTTLGYVAESAFGVTPATPAFNLLRFTGESLKYNITNTTSEEIRPDRTEVDTIQTDASVDGSFNFELSFDSFKGLLAAALCNSWAAGTGDQLVLANGVSLTTFTVQKHFTDITPGEYHNFRGLAIDTLAINLELGKIVTGSFGFMGATAEQVQAQITGATTVTAGTNSPMNAVTDLQNFSIGGTPYSGCLSKLSLNIKNNVRANKCLGTLGPKAMKLGTIQVTGDMTLYFNEGSNFSNYLTGTEFAISFDMVDDDGNKYTFSFPRAKFESADVVAGGKNSDVMMNAKWRALFDSTSGHVLNITADPA